MGVSRQVKNSGRTSIMSGQNTYSSYGQYNKCGVNVCRVEGPQGSQGPQGPYGLLGPQGSQGPKGNSGQNGFQGAQGHQGSQGPSGASHITQALYFYDDLSGGQGGNTYTLQYNSGTTFWSGVNDFIDTSGNITFSSVAEDSIVEIMAHIDASAGSTGQSNYIVLDLSGASGNDSNSVNIIDIDTRTVEKGNLAHLTFGPTVYKIIASSSNTANQILTINKNNVYQARAKLGRDYDLSEIKLSIRVSAIGIV